MTNSSVYLDYEFGRYLNKTGELDDNHVTVGIDHALFPWLYLRAGAGIDFLATAVGTWAPASTSPGGVRLTWAINTTPCRKCTANSGGPR